LLALLWLLDPAAPGVVFGAGDLLRAWEDGGLLPALGLAFRAGCFPCALLDNAGRAGDLPRAWEDGGLLPGLLWLLDPAALGLAFRAGCFPLDNGGRASDLPRVGEDGDLLLVLLWLLVDLGRAAPGPAFHAGFGLLPCDDTLFRELDREPDLVDGARLLGGKLAGEPGLGGELFCEPSEPLGSFDDAEPLPL